MSESRDTIGVGLMGLGVVGSGVAAILSQKAQDIANYVGCPLVVRGILVRDRTKGRPMAVSPELITTNAKELLRNPSVQIIIEVLGGERPAVDYIREALREGKHVVTANKEVIAKHGTELLALATEQGLGLMYEASVGGGIPLIAPFNQDLIANRIYAIQAIINGTTNYILTRMARDGLDFQAALDQARKLGYAEPDPTNDIEGVDAAYKLAILATLAFHTKVLPADIYCEGIARMTDRDFRYAKELGYTIKLLAIARDEDGHIQARVHPAFLAEDLPLARIDGAFNAVQVEGDLVGRILFSGPGAGPLPTSSAIVADLIALAHSIKLGLRPQLRPPLDAAKTLKPMAEVETRYYIRMTVPDRAGVLAQIAKTLGEHLISIASVVQKETDDSAQTAELVIITHRAKEAAMQAALREVAKLSVVVEIGNFIRIEG